jgi:hypothetical protein
LEVGHPAYARPGKSLLGKQSYQDIRAEGSAVNAVEIHHQNYLDMLAETGVHP